MSEVLGRPVRFQQISGTDHKARMTGPGTSPEPACERIQRQTLCPNQVKQHGRIFFVDLEMLL